MQYWTGTSEDKIGQSLGKSFVLNTGNPLVPPYSAIGFSKDGALNGIAIFTDYTESSVELHLYAPDCMYRHTISFVLDYIFNTLKCNIFIVKPYRSNKKLLKIIGRIAGNYKSYRCTIEQYYGPNSDEDAILHVFNREWAEKWIKISAESTKSTSRA